MFLDMVGVITTSKLSILSTFQGGLPEPPPMSSRVNNKIIFEIIENYFSNFSIEANPEQTSSVDLAPSKVEAIAEPKAEAVADSKAEDEVDELSALEGSERDRRQFLNYWLTITKTTTLTSYTTTSSLSAIYCTPYDFLYNPCAGDGSGPGKKKRKKRSGADMD